jgi:mRNA interferase HigB
MLVIALSRLRSFWETRKGDASIAERDLRTWRKLANAANWSNFAELKQTFGSADKVGNYIVFDVGNNRYRLIGRVFYAQGVHKDGRIYVLQVMDHAEYDKQRWIDDCRCHKPPPKKTATAKADRSRKWAAARVQKYKGGRSQNGH